MQEEMQTEDELSLSDIFRAIWSRIWAIVAALVIGAAAGMGIAFLKYHDVHYYGTTIDYYIAPIAQSSADNEVMGVGGGKVYSDNLIDALIQLIDSDDFDRQLMEGLPEAAGIEKDSKEELEFFKLRKKTVSYSYKGGNVLSVKISALNDPEFAEHLQEQFEKILSPYIESVMSDIDSTMAKCKIINNRPSDLLNEGQTVKEMIKFGLIIGLVSFIVACIVVVIVDRADTRLRDYEELPRKFNVPVLGVIPRIETLPDDRHDVKHTEERK